MKILCTKIMFFLYNFIISTQMSSENTYHFSVTSIPDDISQYNSSTNFVLKDDNSYILSNQTTQNTNVFSDNQYSTEWTQIPPESINQNFKDSMHPTHIYNDQIQHNANYSCQSSFNNQSETSFNYNDDQNSHNNFFFPTYSFLPNFYVSPIHKIENTTNKNFTKENCEFMNFDSNGHSYAQNIENSSAYFTSYQENTDQNGF